MSTEDKLMIAVVLFVVFFWSAVMSVVVHFVVKFW